MYRVIRAFTDLKASHVYYVGDAFPYNGVYVDDDRLSELASNKNRMGVPLIEEIEEKPKRTRKKKDEE